MQANLTALRTLRSLQDENRTANEADVAALARWTSWGAVPGIFDDSDARWRAEREQLQALLTEQEYTQARRTVLNAHFTDPAIVQACWGALEDLGFDAGTGPSVLEPGCGGGNFIAAAPAGVRVTGVELDATTASIAQALHPEAIIRAESFTTTPVATDSLDAVVGNVPFGSVRLHDPSDNPGRRMAIHNHFITKSLRGLRPGGVAAVVTSRYTMDAVNPEARRTMQAHADLIAAARLPTGAHRRAAGTDALTDVLVFRKPLPGEERGGEDAVWIRTGDLPIGNDSAAVNRWFLEHPETILGTPALARGLYSDHELVVNPVADSDPGVDLAATLRPALIEARDRGQGWNPAPAREPDRQPVVAVPDATAQRWDGHIQANPDGSFSRSRMGQLEPMRVGRGTARELRELLALRDGARSLLEAEAAEKDDTPQITDARTELRQRWEEYVSTYGPINRFTISTSGHPARDSDGNEVQGTRRTTPRAVTLLRDDPFGSLVKSLELFDERRQQAEPAALMRERVVLPRPEILGADTPDEALAVSLDRRGTVDVDDIAALLGVDPEQARQQLGTLVYDDPDGGGLVPRAEYLSGNVRKKLAAAQAVVEDRPELAGNVEALRQVIPADLGPADIIPHAGAVWIADTDHQTFLRELLGDRRAQVTLLYGNTWEVKAERGTVAARGQWGTDRMAADEIFKNVLEQRPCQVTDPHPDDKNKRIPNPVQSEAANAKAEAIQERFTAWVWEDPARAERLVAEYNWRFNAQVRRQYSHEGDRLRLPGLVRTFVPDDHQRAAVARMISEPAVGLFHEVGAGKTAEMVMGVTELKRLGMAGKPAVVVPNHMLEQFQREWLQLYPRSRLLAASSQDLTRDKRREFVARVATHDWDAIVLTRTAFSALEVAPETARVYESRQLEELRSALERVQDSNGRSTTIKRIEKQVANLEEALREKQDKAISDPGLTFEQTGIDYLCVDELHDYKNLMTPSAIADANIPGSGRATDLHLKLEYLRDHHGHRVVTGATATPIANSVTEAHVMQRYLRPDLLRDAGVENFDSWAATFGQVVTAPEMTVAAGSSFKMKTRLARYQNVPEMMQLWGAFADVQTAEDLQLPVPELRERADGRRAPEVVAVEPSSDQLAYMEHIMQRVDRMPSIDKHEDNMLKVSNDGRLAALDMRMHGHPKSPEPGKIEVAAARIAGEWRDHAEDVFVDRETGSPSPKRGGFQLAFLDVGTPGGSSQFNAYAALRTELVQHHGMDPDRIRFMHEAGTDQAKARLFAACRSGDVDLLVGSTSKMGVGTNVQDRAIALHDIDVPWRPADLHQRHGRVIRRGNQNAEVGIYQYVTTGSFDAFMWQTVERKSRFIDQVMAGRVDAREVEDIGDGTLSASEAKAAGTGNPLILDQAAAQQDLSRLHRLERAHRAQKSYLDRTLTTSTTKADRLTEQAQEITEAADRTVETKGDAFRFTTTRGDVLTDRGQAAEEILRIASWIPERGYEAYAEGASTPVGTLGGHQVQVHSRTGVDHSNAAVISLTGVPRTETSWPRSDFAQGTGAGMVASLESRIRRLPATAATVTDEAGQARSQAQDARRQLDAPNPHTAALAQAQAKLDTINAAITEQANPTPAEPSDAQEQTPNADETGHTPPLAGTAADVAPQSPAVSDPDVRAAAAMRGIFVNRAGRPATGRTAVPISQRPERQRSRDEHLER